jgi:hypothetical protein
MARRTVRRDRGVRGILGVVADRGVGKVHRGVTEVRCRRESRHARRGKRERERKNSG